MSHVRELLSDAAKQIDRLDAELLVAHVLGKNRTFILTHPETILSAEEKKQFQDCVARRACHEPLAYILGEKEFYGRSFLVTQATLIPRPETEILIEQVLQSMTKKELPMSEKENIAIIDVGTGSGNIIITLACELASFSRKKNISFFASDLSVPALRVAKQNAERLQKENNISFLHGDLLTPHLKNNILQSKTIVITANLPYISPKIFRSVTEDIRDYEPQSALVSNAHGLAHYHRLLSQVKKYFSKQHLMLFLEISPEQKASLQEYISSLFPEAFLTFTPDLAGRIRVAVIESRPI